MDLMIASITFTKARWKASYSVRVVQLSWSDTMYHKVLLELHSLSLTCSLVPRPVCALHEVHITSVEDSLGEIEWCKNKAAIKAHPDKPAYLV